MRPASMLPFTATSATVHLDGMPFDIANGLFEIGAGTFIGHGASVPVELIRSHAVIPLAAASPLADS